MKKTVLTIIVLHVLLVSCKDEYGRFTQSDWLIPVDEILDGGPGKDGIPALENPSFVQADENDVIKDTDLIIGVKYGNEVRAYPHYILDWHEIINDDVDGLKTAITYCPLTGTGIGWIREINESVTTFGVSGLLYNSNLMPYDRKTNSTWSQLRLDCVNGELAGAQINTHQVVETSWHVWKRMYPETRVLSNQTGYNRAYGLYPYGDYKSNPSLIFPVTNTDNRLSSKEIVHGIIVNGKVMVYRKPSFNDSTRVINDTFEQMEIVIAGTKTDNIIVSFIRQIDSQTLTFSALQNSLPYIMQDETGTQYDIFGIGKGGSNDGKQLETTNGFHGFWFSWPAFYSEVTIFEYEN